MEKLQGQDCSFKISFLPRYMPKSIGSILETMKAPLSLQALLGNIDARPSQPTKES